MKDLRLTEETKTGCKDYKSCGREDYQHRNYNYHKIRLCVHSGND